MTASAPATASTVMYQVRSFLLSLCNAEKDGRVLVHREGASSAGRRDVRFKFVLLNPSVHFRPFVDEARAVILAGGTMHPIDEVVQLLLASAPPKRIRVFSCGHVVPEHAILGLAVGEGPTGVPFRFTYQTRTRPDIVDELGRAIVNLALLVPQGLVIFFPSYDYEAFVTQERWSAPVRLADGSQGPSVMTQLANRKRVFREPRSSAEVDALLSDYAKAIDEDPRGAVLFAVVGGKLSEGLNFSDGLARAVAVIGMPFPSVDDPELRARMSYLDAVRGSGAGNTYYENLCMKAVNQSIGTRTGSWGFAGRGLGQGVFVARAGVGEGEEERSGVGAHVRG